MDAFDILEIWRVLQAVSPRTVFIGAAAFPLLVAFTSVSINETRSSPVTSEASASALLERARSVWSAVSQPRVLVPTLFLFAWKATPTSGSAFFYYLTGELNFQPE